MMNTLKIFRNKWCIRIAIALLLLVSILLSPVYYAQTQGVCLKKGRVLSEEELRKAVLLNYVNYYLKDSYDSARRWGGKSWVGINSPAQETDLLKLVEAAYQSGKSIEENFGLKILLKGRNEGLGYEEVTADKLQEPFIFISYEVGNLFPFISTEMKKILLNELLPSELDTVRRKINFYTTLLGYGNHYYTIIPHAFSGKCCDSRTSYNSDSEKDKQMAFNAARRMLLNSKRQPIKWRIMVSNCGEIYITKDEGINLL